MRDLSQLPIIGLAAAAAWILLDNHPNAARRTGRIGIVAGAYSEGRNQLIAGNMTDVYIAGHSALTCVLAQGTFFSGTPAQERHAALINAMEALEQAIADAQEGVSMQPVSGDKPQRDALAVVKTAAEQLITQARAAMDAARIEKRAYDGAGSVFWQAVASISARVASRGRQRPNVEYDELRRRLTPAAESGPSSEGAPTRSAVDIMNDLNNRMRSLVLTTGTLLDATPNYSQRIESVAACPSQAG